MNCETLIEFYESLGIPSENIRTDISFLSNHKDTIINALTTLLPKKGKTLMIFDNVGYDHDANGLKPIRGFEEIIIDVIEILHGHNNEGIDILVTTRREETRFKNGKLLIIDGFNTK